MIQENTMPVTLPTVEFDPDGGTIWVDITYPETLLFCRYLMQLRDADTNELIDGYEHITGDNENSADDTYALPTPAYVNDGCVLMIFHTIMDQNGDGGTYRISITIRQGGTVLWKSPDTPYDITGEQDMKQTLLKFMLPED